MAIPTYAECVSLCLFHLNDSLSEVWNSDGSSGKTSLAYPFGIAYRQMFAEMDRAGVAVPEKTVWCNLPAYSTTLTPAQAGISDLGKLQSEGLWERGSYTAVTITGATNATPIVVTATTHGLATNQEVVISGVGGATGANGRWFVNVVDADTFELIGSAAGGAYSSGGTVTTSTDRFRPVYLVEDLSDRAPVDLLAEFEFDGGIFRFIGAKTDRQLRITFLASGAPPTSGSVGVDDSLNFLAARMAGLAGAPKGGGVARLAAMKDIEALGPNLDGKGGYLAALLDTATKAQQAIPSMRQRFRQRRTNWDTGVFY